ncbi:MAG: DUF5024 domain-containing protein [Prevotella sp.]
MKRLTLLLCLLAAFMAQATAQNKIDQMVDKFAATGDCTFTSVVERNTKTKRVEKVVKMLTTEGKSVGNLRNAFEEEARNGTLTEKREDGVTTLVLTTQDSKTNRIYMLRIEDEKMRPKIKTTIIIRMK